jgi:hypothetical protein
MTTAPARSPKDVAVIGAGSYGTCLAILAASAGHRVDFWCRGAAAAAELEATRENKLYLPGFTLPAGVTVTADLEAAVRGKQIVVGVTPSHAIRDVLGRAAAWLDPDVIVVNASKGLEDGTLQTIDQVYADIFPARIAGPRDLPVGADLRRRDRRRHAVGDRAGRPRSRDRGDGPAGAVDRSLPHLRRPTT